MIGVIAVAVITGAAGTAVTVLVNLTAVALLSPHSDVYVNLTLSPAPAAALLINLTSITCVVSDPFDDIISASAPSVPANDQRLPVTDVIPVVAPLAAGNAGAVKRYTLPSHTLVMIGVIAVAVITGAAGTVVTVLANLTAVALLSPHSDVYTNLTLSPAPAAALLVNLTSITFDVSVPDIISASAPSVPANDHCLPVTDATVAIVEAAGNTGAVKRYTLPSHTLVVIGVILIVVANGATGTDVHVPITATLEAATQLVDTTLDKANNFLVTPDVVNDVSYVNEPLFNKVVADNESEYQSIVTDGSLDVTLN
jgi:hypothetical protein